MGNTDKLITKARTSPKNLRFNEICLLAEKVGFVFKNQSGDHKIYEHSVHKEVIMNFQPDKRNKSKAKFYQVNQLLDFIDNKMP